MYDMVIELVSAIWGHDWILQQKNDICGKADEIQIKSLHHFLKFKFCVG